MTENYSSFMLMMSADTTESSISSWEGPPIFVFPNGFLLISIITLHLEYIVPSGRPEGSGIHGPK